MPHSKAKAAFIGNLLLFVPPGRKTIRAYFLIPVYRKKNGQMEKVDFITHLFFCQLLINPGAR